jgi:hypothetical protein
VYDVTVNRLRLRLRLSFVGELHDVNAPTAACATPQSGHPLSASSRTMADLPPPPPKSVPSDDALNVETTLDASRDVALPVESPNPWATAPAPPPTTTVAVPPPPADDATATWQAAAQPQSPIAHPAPQDVVDEFDPLSEAQAAAWADVEGHPAPPPPPKEKEAAPTAPPTTQPGQPVDVPAARSNLGSGLAALAQKLSISLPRQGAHAAPPLRDRPASLDGAAPVASPMLRTFAAQLKRVGKRRSTALASDKDADVDDYDEDDKAVARTQSPPRPAVPSKDDEKPFDFQLFLDQMKTKGAEPVAKYLRSWVDLKSKPGGC